MSWIKRVTQYLGAMILPSTATIFFLGLAIYENGMLRVFTHICKNIVFLIPRIPNTIAKIWNERHVVFSTDQLMFKLIALIVGFPFVMLFLLLDDYES